MESTRRRLRRAIPWLRRRHAEAFKPQTPGARKSKTSAREREFEANRVRKAEKEQAKLERRRAAVLPDMRDAVAELLRREEGMPLEAYAHRIASQHGEDGITVEVFRRIGV